MSIFMLFNQYSTKQLHDLMVEKGFKRKPGSQSVGVNP